MDHEECQTQEFADDILLADESTRLIALQADVRALVVAARLRTSSFVNQELTLLNWDVGRRIRTELLLERRADYSKEVVERLAIVLSNQFGRGFGRRNLFNMIRFADCFADRQIVQTLSAQLSWSHFVELLTLNEPLKREFYAELARLHRWSVRTLRDKTRSMLFERTALSRKPDELIQQ